MTAFKRAGYHRTSKYGVQHWVSGTTVYRDDWSRSSYSYTPPPYRPTPPPAPIRDGFFERYPEFEKVRRRAACFVNPNAKCPVCGESVFYYQNERGSRVFFDELGPPWPKHPCTDTSLNGLNFPRSDGAFEPRKPSMIGEIREWHKALGVDPEADFAEKHKTAAWPLAKIVKRMKGGKQVFLILKPIQQGRASKVYISCKSLPKCCKEGYTLTIQKGKLSFFDTAVMDSKEIPIKRYRGASAFLEAMTE